MLRQRLDQRQVQKLILAPGPPAGHQAPAPDEPGAHRGHRRGAFREPDDRARGGSGDRSRRAPKSRRRRTPRPRPASRKRPPEEAREPEPPEKRSPISEPPKSPDEVEKLDAEASFQDYLDDGFRPNFSEKRDAVSLENTLSRSPSLWDHLNWQASLTFFEPEEREIAQFIIGNINEDGYLGSPVEEIARLVPGGAGKGRSHPREDQDVRSGRRRAASTSGRPSSPRWTISTSRTRSPGPSSADHLPLLEKSDFAQLARVLDIPPAEVKDHIEMIRSLDPAPGRKYSRGEDVLRRPRHHRHQGGGRVEGRS